jgi:enterochelin esterase family protein
MGGRQALQIGLTNLETFAWIAAFSGAVFDPLDPETAFGGAFRDPEAFNRQVRSLWLSAGTAEERFVQAVQGMQDVFSRQGIKHEVYLSEGTSHEWQTWRRSLRRFAPLLFRAATG